MIRHKRYPLKNRGPSTVGIARIGTQVLQAIAKASMELRTNARSSASSVQIKFAHEYMTGTMAFSTLDTATAYHLYPNGDLSYATKAMWPTKAMICATPKSGNRAL